MNLFLLFSFLAFAVGSSHAQDLTVLTENLCGTWKVTSITWDYGNAEPDPANVPGDMIYHFLPDGTYNTISHFSTEEYRDSGNWRFLKEGKQIEYYDRVAPGFDNLQDYQEEILELTATRLTLLGPLEGGISAMYLEKQ